MNVFGDSYIHKVAGTVAGQSGVSKDYCAREDPGSRGPQTLPANGEDNFPEEFWKLYGIKITMVVGRMSPEARGRIAACGLGHESSSKLLGHYKMAYGQDLDSAQSGNDLLTLLASYVVAAAMVDIIRSAGRKRAKEKFTTSEWANLCSGFGIGSRPK